MKNPLLLALMTLSFLACNRSAKLLEKGKSEKALNVSIRHLKKGKVRDSDVYAFEKSFLLETEKDAKWVRNTKRYGQSDKWVAIHNKAKRMVARQHKVQQVLYRLNDKGYYPKMEFYPASDLLEEARDKAAIYFYAQAQEFIPAARSGNRIAARSAYSHLEKVEKYRSNFRDTEFLRTEMLDLGTTHILLNPIEDNVYQEEDEFLFASFFRNRRFPKKENWKVFHLSQPENGRIDYRLDLQFANLYVSPNIENVSICTNTETIIDGYVEEQTWNEKDSTYTIERKPVFVDVSVSVYTYEQEKRASLNLLANLYDVQNGRQIDQYIFNGSDSWHNEYSLVYGDRRALIGVCQDWRGCQQWYPNEGSLLQNAVSCTYAPFYRKMKRRIE